MLTLGEGSVAHGDGCEVKTQKEAGFGRADVVIAVTGEDEDNLIICQMAKVFWQVSRVVARVSNPSHDEIFHALDIDDVVSSTKIIFSLIEQYLEFNELVSVGTLGKGEYEVVQTLLSTHSPILKKKAHEVQLPPQSHFVWLLRGESPQTIQPDIQFQQGDIIAVISPTKHVKALRDFLCS